MNENMKKGQKEARIGLDSEKDIVQLINTDEEFRNRMKECLHGLGFAIKGEIRARRDNVKIDIFIEDDLKIGASIKSSTKTTFHNLDRRWLEKWRELLTMPDDISTIIKEAILRIARNSKDRFILPENQEDIKSFFMGHVASIVSEIFTRGEKELKLLIINDKRNRKLCLFKMAEVVNFLVENVQNNISFSPKGIIRFGDFITVQRKSGDSSQITISKTDWKHPGNQLQFKFSPLKFAEHIEKNTNIRICNVLY